jgi:hypothetical protein
MKVLGQTQYDLNLFRSMGTEADTCRKYILPKLFEKGWPKNPIPLPNSGLLPMVTAGRGEPTAIK